MGMTETTTYQVVCDGTDCFAEGDAAESEGAAREYAREAGFKHVGHWLCAKCARAAVEPAPPAGAPAGSAHSRAAPTRPRRSPRPKSFAAQFHAAATRAPADYAAEETATLRTARKTAEEALAHIAKIGCMQMPNEPEFFCKHDGSAHSIYCPKRIAAEALTSIRAARGEEGR